MKGRQLPFRAIEELALAIEPEAKKQPDVLRLMTYPSVQPTHGY
jgi:hypothetical protein